MNPTDQTGASRALYSLSPLPPPITTRSFFSRALAFRSIDCCSHSSASSSLSMYDSCSSWGWRIDGLHLVVRCGCADQPYLLLALRRRPQQRRQLLLHRRVAVPLGQSLGRTRATAVRRRLIDGGRARRARLHFGAVPCRPLQMGGQPPGRAVLFGRHARLIGEETDALRRAAAAGARMNRRYRALRRQRDALRNQANRRRGRVQVVRSGARLGDQAARVLAQSDLPVFLQRATTTTSD